MRLYIYYNIRCNANKEREDRRKKGGKNTTTRVVRSSQLK